jgi:hypothetical protein
MQMRKAQAIVVCWNAILRGSSLFDCDDTSRKRAGILEVFAS